MVDGRLQVSGQSEAAANAEKLEWKRQEEMTDALGNVVRVAPCLPVSKSCATGYWHCRLVKWFGAVCMACWRVIQKRSLGMFCRH